MKKISSIQIFAAIIIALFGFFAFFARQNTGIENIRSNSVAEIQAEIPPPAQKNIEQKILPKEAKQTETITLVAGSSTASLFFAPGQTLYEALRMEENSKAISFDGKEYPGLGFLVTDIGALHQGSGKYLIYSINGIEASVGVSSYILKDGDVVSWELK